MTSVHNNDSKKPRRRRGEGTIYWDSKKHSHVAEMSFGFLPSGKRDRIRGFGKTKSAARDDLKRRCDEREKGVVGTGKRTVAEAVNGFIGEEKTKGIKSSNTIRLWRSYADNHVIPGVGAAKLRGRDALDENNILKWLIDEAKSLSDSTLKSILSLLRRSLTWAKRQKWVTVNVAEGVEPPKGARAGRPRKSAKLGQLSRLFKTAKTETHGLWIWPYLVLCVLTGIRAEEVRRLEWTHVILGSETYADGTVVPPHIRIWKSVREGDVTKTKKSYRAVALAAPLVKVLEWWKVKQAEQRFTSNYKHTDIRLCFGTRDDKVRSHRNVRRRLYQLCDKAEIGRVSPAETRNSFVSVMSALGGSEELIADICGHSTPVVTRTVYRDDLRPVITGGADLIAGWFEGLDT